MNENKCPFTGKTYVWSGDTSSNGHKCSSFSEMSWKNKNINQLLWSRDIRIYLISFLCCHLLGCCEREVVCIGYYSEKICFWKPLKRITNTPLPSGAGFIQFTCADISFLTWVDMLPHSLWEKVIFYEMHSVRTENSEIMMRAPGKIPK